MLVYFTIICIIFLLAFSLKNQDTANMLRNYKGILTTSKVKLLIIAFILIFFAGVRYNVGADYIQYALNFKDYCIQDLLLNGEPGIRIIARLVAKFYNDSAGMFFCMSVITIGLCVLTIARHSPYFLISILLYIFLGCWHESFNSVRQSAAAAILFYGHTFIEERKFIKWLIICFIGYLFHTSAIVFIPLYFIPYNKKINLKTVFTFVFIGIIAAVFYDKAWDLIGILQNKEYVLDVYSTNKISIFRIIVAWTPIFFYLINFRSDSILNREKCNLNFYAFMSLLSATIILAARNSAYLGRLVIYTDVYNTLFWACMFIKFSNKNSNRQKWLLLIMFCYFLYYLNEATGQYLINYMWIFGR